MLHIEGQPAPSWHVQLQVLGHDHIVAVATAPPDAMQDQVLLFWAHVPKVMQLLSVSHSMRQCASGVTCSCTCDCHGEPSVGMIHGAVS